MNAYFAGEEAVMADAYTNCITHLFISLAFFFILPFGIVISCAALFVSFWTTKYMMLYYTHVLLMLILYSYSAHTLPCSMLLYATHTLHSTLLIFYSSLYSSGT
jgi:hypothetical protein